MERNLRRSNHIQSSEMVHGTEGSEGLHHALLVRLCMVNLIYSIFAGSKNCLDIAHFFMAFGSQVPLVICSYRKFRLPVLFRMNKHRIVLGSVKVQDRSFHTILDLDPLHGKVYCLLCLSGHNGHCVSHKAQVLIQDHSVIRTKLRIGLSC